VLREVEKQRAAHWVAGIVEQAQKRIFQIYAEPFIVHVVNGRKKSSRTQSGKRLD
jgi:hypothetical protein